MATAYEDKQIDEPIIVANLLNGQSIATLQAAFPLNEADFLRLQRSPPITAGLALAVFSGVIGYAISLWPKIEPVLVGDPLQLSNSETRTIMLGTVLSAVLYSIGFLWPSDRRKVMSRISRHFRDARTSTHIVGGGK